MEKKFHDKFDFDQASYRHFFFIKTFGFIALGLCPIVISLLFINDIPFQKYGLTIIPETIMFSVFWIFDSFSSIGLFQI